MHLPHFLLLISVIVIWGINFIFAKTCLVEIPPLLLCALRFFFASIPFIFFIKPPKIAFTRLVAYGLIMFALQFGLMFLSLSVGMTPGIASLIMQLQVFFSMFYAVTFLNEKIHPWKILGAIVSSLGIGLVGFHLDESISLLGFILILCASATWGIGNLISKKSQTTDIMGLVIWGSFISFPVMFVLSLIFEGYPVIVASLEHITLKAIGSLIYIVYISTLVGYIGWNWLLSRYPMNTIVPYALLIPVVGLVSSVLILGEPFQLWKLEASILVLAGLGINGLSSFLSLPRKVKQIY